MEILTAYVRVNAPWPRKIVHPQKPWQECSPGEAPLTATSPPLPKLATDIQAVLTVLSRRNLKHEKEGKRLDLRDTELRRAILSEAHLEGAFFMAVNLEWALFVRAHLEGTFFGFACLKNAGFSGAYLQWARFDRANLEGAHLDGANIEGASFGFAFLKGVHGLTIDQLASVRTLYGSQLDDDRLEVVRRLHPHLLEGPPL